MNLVSISMFFTSMNDLIACTTSYIDESHALQSSLLKLALAQSLNTHERRDSQ
jgi:hypothetical protein